MSTKKASFGKPTTDLPERNPGRVTNGPAAYWVDVADHCRRNKGQWVPVTIGALSVDRHRQIPSNMRRGQLAAFRRGNWQSAYRNGQLYIRYDGEATTSSVVHIRAS